MALVFKCKHLFYGFLATSACVLGVVYLMGFRVNITPSLPMGIYRIVNDPIGVGKYVTFCIPKNSEDLPDLGKNNKPCTLNSGGLPVLKQVVSIDAGLDQITVMGSHPHSFDSRVFGTIKSSDIKAVLNPTYIFERQPR